MITNIVPWLLLVGFLSVVVLLWRMVSAIQRTAGLQMLKQDRKRLDEMQLISTLVEKLYNPQNLDVARNHAHERMLQRQLDAQERKTAVDMPVPPHAGLEMEPSHEIEDAVHL
jgi:hypothetical protein